MNYVSYSLWGDKEIYLVGALKNLDQVKEILTLKVSKGCPATIPHILETAPATQETLNCYQNVCLC